MTDTNLSSEARLPGEDVWLNELVDCYGHRDKLRTVLRAFSANLKQQAASPLREQLAGLRDKLAKWLHFKLAAAQNMPYEDGDTCDDCLAMINEDVLPLLAAYPAVPTSRQAGVEQAQAALEHDRTKVAECVTRIKNELHSYDWLITSRGSYEWDDDKWHEEFKRASEAIWEAIEPMIKIAADWSNCPTKWEDVQAARPSAASERGVNERLPHISWKV